MHEDQEGLVEVAEEAVAVARCVGVESVEGVNKGWDGAIRDVVDIKSLPERWWLSFRFVEGGSLVVDVQGFESSKLWAEQVMVSSKEQGARVKLHG